MNTLVREADIKTVNLIHIRNPFEPNVFDNEVVRLSDDLSLSACVRNIEGEFVASLNGGIVYDNFSDVFLSDGDSVVVSHVPLDGGSGDEKSILRFAAFVALAVYAPQFAVGFGQAGSVGYTLAFAGAMTAGSMLINSILPPPTPSVAGGSDDVENSPSYGIDGPKNVATEDVPVPIPYGKFRMGGNIIGLRTENDLDSQYVYMLMNAGEGPIAGISDIMINDQPIDNYSDKQWLWRAGVENQGIITWFQDSYVPHIIGTTLTDAWSNYTATGQIDKIRFDMVFPAGLYVIDQSSGKTRSQSVTFDLEYRPIAGVWSPLNVATIGDGIYISVVVYFDPNYIVTGSEVTVNDYIYSEGGAGADGLGENSILVGYHEVRPTYGSSWTVVSQSRNPVRVSIVSEDFAIGDYEFRVRRTTPGASDYIIDTCTLNEAYEITTNDISYNHTALVALRIRLSDQLRGMPKVTYLNHGRLIKVWEDNAWVVKASNNPAWVALDALTNGRFGGGVLESRIDIPKWKEWAEHCTALGLEFNGVFDQSSNVWDSLRHVFRAGRAQIVRVGTRYSVAIEKDETPVMMFSVANMIRDSFSMSWLPMSDRANVVEVSYYDKVNDYSRTTIKLYDEEEFQRGAEQRVASVTLKGVTDASRAYKEAVLMLNMSRLLQQTVTFDSPLESIGCTVGSLIYVQHDLPSWAQAGRFEAGSSTTVMQLDRPAEMTQGRIYKILVKYDAVQVAANVVSSVVGSALYLTGYDGVSKVTRIVINGGEYPVLRTFSDVIGNGVELESTTGMSATDSYVLWDTDSIEERNVVNNAVGTEFFSVVTLQSPLTYAPDQYVSWMFGDTTKIKKTFRVLDIAGSSDYERTITALEFNAAVYDATGILETPNASIGSLAIGHVEIDGVSEGLIRAGNSVISKVSLNWTPPSTGIYEGVDIYVSVNNGPERLVTSVRGGASRFDTTEYEEADYLIFKVVAFDTVGVRASIATAPTRSHTVVGKSAPPSNVTGFLASVQKAGVRVTWNAATDLDLQGYRLVYGASYESGAVLYEGNSTAFVWDFRGAGSYTLWIKAVDTSGNESLLATSSTVIIDTPSSFVVGNSFAESNVVFSWDAAVASFPILGYEIRQGATWDTALSVASVTATSFSLRANWSGTRKFWISAYDAAGNYSPAVSVDVFILTPTEVSVTHQTIDNNVLLSWSKSTATLPIAQYEVRRGSDFDTAAVIGFTQGTFIPLFETDAGTYRYWIVAVDSAGNYGLGSSTTATVSQPPDYILRDDLDVQFVSGTKVNALSPEPGHLSMLMNTTETWAQHFSNNGWTTIQDQINAGFMFYGLPGETSGSYEEIIDYGAVLAGTMITLTTDVNTLQGTMDLAPTVSVRKLDTDPWTDYVGLWQVFAGDFQFVKVRIDASADGRDDLIDLHLNVRLSFKQKSDAGNRTITTNHFGIDCTPSTAYASISGGSASLTNFTDDGSSQTWECWFRPEGVPSGGAATDGYIFARSGHHTGFSHGHATGDTKFTLWYSDNTPLTLSSATPLEYGEWSHMMVTIDESLNIAKLYINEVMVSEGAITKPLKDHVSNYFVGGPGTSLYGVNGQVAGCRLYQRALSAIEVSQHYRRVFANEANLVLNIPFSENTGSVANDSTANNNDATFANGALWGAGIGDVIFPNTTFVDIESITLNASGITPVTPMYDFFDRPYPDRFHAYLFNTNTGARMTGSYSWSVRGQ